MGYTIPGREIPVYGTYDVCVVGGGTAGVIAALSAAREGLSVLIVEQFGSLGGSGTVGLVLPVMPTCMEGNPQCSYFGERINRTLSARGYNMPDTDDNRAWQDSLYLKFILDELCREYGVEVLFHAFFNTCIREGNRITGVTCATKAGEQAIFAKRVIDCTGDADGLCLCERRSGDREESADLAALHRWRDRSAAVPGIRQRAFRTSASLRLPSYLRSRIAWKGKYAVGSVF